MLSKTHPLLVSFKPRSRLSMAILIWITILRVGAVEVTYKATDLLDLISGDDLWRYEYRASGFSFGADQGFTIFFKLGDFEQLQNPPPHVNDDWEVITIQPDPLLPDDGFYDGLSLNVDGASLADPFVLDFVWKGSHTPGSQPYEIYSLEPDYTVLASGFTVPATAVPEPSNRFDIALMLILTFVAGRYATPPQESRLRILRGECSYTSSYNEWV